MVVALLLPSGTDTTHLCLSSATTPEQGKEGQGREGGRRGWGGVGGGGIEIGWSGGGQHP